MAESNGNSAQEFFREQGKMLLEFTKEHSPDEELAIMPSFLEIESLLRDAVATGDDQVAECFLELMENAAQQFASVLTEATVQLARER